MGPGIRGQTLRGLSPSCFLGACPHRHPLDGGASNSVHGGWWVSSAFSWHRRTAAPRNALWAGRGFSHPFPGAGGRWGMRSRYGTFLAQRRRGRREALYVPAVLVVPVITTWSASMGSCQLPASQLPDNQLPLAFSTRWQRVVLAGRLFKDDSPHRPVLVCSHLRKGQKRQKGQEGRANEKRGITPCRNNRRKNGIIFCINASPMSAETEIECER